MYYFKHNEKGEWKSSKLSKPEVEKVRQITIIECAKTYKHINDLLSKGAEKLGIKPSERLALEIFRKVAPTFDSIALDYIRTESAKGEKTGEPAQT